MRATTPYLIAEMGVNFYDTAKVEGISPVDAAKRYIDGAAEAGTSYFRSMIRSTKPSLQNFANMHTSKGWTLPLRRSTMPVLTI